jgi:hypothetical protein
MRRGNSTRWAVVLMWGISGCVQTPSDSSLGLSLRASPKTIDARGQTSKLTVVASLENGDPGTGDVALTATAGTLSTDAITLSSGTGTATYSCSADTDATCPGTQSITAQWHGVEQKVTLTVANPPFVPSADAGCIGTFLQENQIFVFLYQCPEPDGGACLYKGRVDAGGFDELCNGGEGDLCLTQAACRAGGCTTTFPVLQGDIGYCTIWYCSQPSGPCGDGGYCIDHFGYLCSTGAAGSPCSSGADCLDGGACITYASASGVGQECTYGRSGDPCSQATDCDSGMCNLLPTGAGRVCQ